MGRHRLAKTHRRHPLPQRRLIQQTRLGGQRRAVVERHALAQAPQLLLVRRAFDLHPVGLRQLVPGVGDARLQATVVGQQQQALAVAVQAPGRIHARHRDEVLEGRAPLLVVELGQYVERLVEQQQLRLARRRLGHPAWRRADGMTRGRTRGTGHDWKRVGLIGVPGGMLGCPRA